MSMESRKFIDVDGINTSYFEKGRGEPLILLHGGNFGSNQLADSALDFSTNFDGLSTRYSVFAIDKIGQGYSANPKNRQDYTMQRVVEHACSTLDALGIRDAHLVGHSRGAYLVCAMTLQRPDLVKTVTFVDSNTLAPGVGLNDIVLANPPGKPLSAACQRWVIEKYSYSSHHITDDWIDEIVKIAKRPEYEEARKIITDDGLRYTQFMPLLAREKLQMFAQIRDNGLQRPTNLIWGLNDPTAPVDMCRALFDLCALRESKTQMHIINQAGHFSFREHPEEFNACLTGFIEGVA